MGSSTSPHMALQPCSYSYCHNWWWPVITRHLKRSNWMRHSWEVLSSYSQITLKNGGCWIYRCSFSWWASSTVSSFWGICRMRGPLILFREFSSLSQWSSQSYGTFQMPTITDGTQPTTRLAYCCKLLHSSYLSLCERMDLKIIRQCLSKSFQSRHSAISYTTSLL